MKKLNEILGKCQKEETEGLTSSVQKLIELTPAITGMFKHGIMNIARREVKDFKMNDQLKGVFNDLFLYFTGNGGFDLNKGIYLHGDFGVGKTVTMLIFRKFLATYFPFNSNGYGFVSVEKLAEHYKEFGNLLKYGRNLTEENKFNPFNLCINEFGKEVDEKYYGTNIQSTINSLLMVRYELFQENKILTHATSNFHPATLECFDPALMDRFKEMFNFVEIKGDSFRK